MTITIEDARPDHLPPIMDDIRPADIREWYAGTGCPDISKCLEHVFQEKRYARVAVDRDGKALCMWGVDPLEGDSASVWLFATNRAVPRALSLHRHLKAEFNRILSKWSHLTAISDDRNPVHHTWLEWLGFTFEGYTFVGPFSLPFKIYKRSP